MNIFAHAGVEHHTSTEAISHILSTNVLIIIAIVTGITGLGLSIQWLMRKLSKETVRITNRRR